MKSASIPYFRLDHLARHYSAEFNRIQQEVLLSGQYFDENEIRGFEEALAARCQREHAVSVACCTDALYFSLLGIGIRPGNLLALPSVSFIATLTPLLRAGAVPVFIDIDPGTGIMDLNHLETIMQKYPLKAVVFADLYGNMVHPGDIKVLSERYGIPFVSDAAQSLGCVREGVPAGKTGQVACFSFDPTKVIHAFGSGGAVLTDDKALAARIRRMRYHGKEGQDYLEHGYNSRINTFQARLLRFQLEKLDEITEDRGRTARRLAGALSDREGIRLLNHGNDIHQYHKFVVLAEEREKLREQLAEAGIQVMIHYPLPLSEYALLHDRTFVNEGIVHAKTFCDQVLSFPLHTFMDEEDVIALCETLTKIA